MSRTRKWEFVAQEATRLAGLGLTPVEISTRIHVKRSTVQRWMAAGKLKDTRRGAKQRRARTVTAKVTHIRSAKAWSAAVRREYSLNETDEELVNLAEAALSTARNHLLPAATQLSAMARFQALVKQLALIARSADASGQQDKGTSEAPSRKNPVVRRHDARDPRQLLMAVK